MTTTMIIIESGIGIREMMKDTTMEMGIDGKRNLHKKIVEN